MIWLSSQERIFAIKDQNLKFSGILFEKNFKFELQELVILNRIESKHLNNDRDRFFKLDGIAMDQFFLTMNPSNY